LLLGEIEIVYQSDYDQSLGQGSKMLEIECEVDIQFFQKTGDIDGMVNQVTLRTGTDQGMAALSTKTDQGVQLTDVVDPMADQDILGDETSRVVTEHTTLAVMGKGMLI
jgi:hypothetical protein